MVPGFSRLNVLISGRYRSESRKLTEEINAAFKRIQAKQALGYIRDGVLEDKFSSDFEESTFRPWELTRAHFSSGGSRNGYKSEIFFFLAISFLMTV